MSPVPFRYPVSYGPARQARKRRAREPVALTRMALALLPALLLALLLAAPLRAGEPVRVVAIGDSLTAGYGLSEAQAFPARLEERFAEEGLPFRAVNAGVSGDTSAGGLTRLDWVLSTEPDVVVVELGPNDGLRGLDLAMTERNLREIVRRTREAGARVLLVGLRIPPNYGPDYAGRFEALYPRLAEELDVPLVPFLLEGVGGVRDLNLGDGIHPTAEGQEVVAANVAPHLRPLVEAEWEERGGAPEEAAAAAAAGEARLGTPAMLPSDPGRLPSRAASAAGESIPAGAAGSTPRSL